MAPARTPWRTAVDAYLADRQPRTLDEIVAACGHHVPPGRAHRATEAERARTVPDPAPRDPSDTTIATGRRDIIRRTLRDTVARGHIVRLPDGRYQLAGER